MTPLPIALITGASSGIGRELARVFASEHYELILVARDRIRLDAIATELRQKYLVPVRVEVCDLGDSAALEEFISSLQKDRQTIDVLVNNAGFGVEGEFASTDWTAERSMIDVNVMAVVRLTKAVLPQMITRRSGKILQVASVAAFCPGPYLALYFASKAFILSFSEALFAEVREYGVSVTTLCPGPTETGFAARLGKDSSVFQGLPIAEPEAVAKLGYKSLIAGKRVAVYGLGYRVIIALAGVLPRGLTLKVITWFLRRNSRARANQAKDFSAL